MIGASIPAVLRERASLQPNDTAFTFLDYQLDWDGAPQCLTWSQLYRRTINIARELRLHGSTGDRVVISAPQGLDYIAGFLASLQAGMLAVPLSVPEAGAHDERIAAVVRDTAPAVILTTTGVVDTVADYARTEEGDNVPLVMEIDRLDLDARKGSSGAGGDDRPEIAYLQYTSGSTRLPAGVMVTHRNLVANFEQVMPSYFAEWGGLAAPDTNCVSWLPLYHDMGLILGVCHPLLGGYRSVLMSPMSFLQRPARWMQQLARNSHAFTAAPNFAFELTVKRTSDEDMAAHDLGDVAGIISGSERIHEATLRRFSDRFRRFNLPEEALRPSYGLAEATVYVATRRRSPGARPVVVEFESEKLAAGHAKRCAEGAGTGLVSYGIPQSPAVRIVDPETRVECPAGTIGEIWVQGDNVALGYWQKPEHSQHTFGAALAASSPGVADEPWLRTGDLGFICESELFIMGRIKDMLILYGRNHYPDDIEATIQEITGGRVAAVSVPGEHTEKLVAIIELKKRDDSHEEAIDKMRLVKRKVTSALSNTHGLGVADLVLVSPGSIPITTSGKIRRSACVERYRHNQFTRIDVSA